jgi:hypothetical protein
MKTPSDTKYIAGPYLDYIFIVFPVWVPIIYFTLISALPEYNALFFLMVMLLLGEPHFAATWFFVLDNKNRKWLLDNKYYSIFLPLLFATILIIVGVQISIAAALFPVLIFNLFHVTRQSIGILKLYGGFKSKNLSLSIWAVYVFSTFFIVIGLIRFTFLLEVVDDYLPIILLVSAIAALLTVLAIFISGRSEGIGLINVATTLTGILMFMPMLFVDRLENAFAMGVGMHYSQYLAITIPLYLRRARMDVKTGANKALRFVASNIYSITFYLLAYAGLMVFLAQKFTYSEVSEEYMHKEMVIFLVPIVFQTLHFYADSFIWRFSTPYIREEIHPHLYEPTSTNTD